MGGIRGDVIGLGFLQTVIMEMGEPPEVQSADPAMRVQARQYTGRIVSVTNAKVFDEPVYNYTRDFPFLWEEMHIPIPYTALPTANAPSRSCWMLSVNMRSVPELGEGALVELERRYFVKRSELDPASSSVSQTIGLNSPYAL